MSHQPQPSPIKIETLDLNSPLDLPVFQDRYAQVWFVGYADGRPQGIYEVDLSPGAPDPEAQLRSAFEEMQPAVPYQAGPVTRQLPAISVVVPSIVARRDELERCLSSLCSLDYPDFEIILVDNRRRRPDDDALPELLARYGTVQVVQEARPGISAARNAGVAAARGEIVVFTDDDVRVDQGWLTALGRRFVSEPDLAAVTGLILPSELETPAQIWFEQYYGGFSGQRTFAPLTLVPGEGWAGRSRVVLKDSAARVVRRFAVYGIGAYGAGANMAFRRSFLQNAGCFDLALGTGTPARGGEDLHALIEVVWRGGRVGYEPAAVVHHQHRRGYDQLLHQMRGNGIGFTAMLTAVIVQDPRHLAGIAALLPLAATRMLQQSLRRLGGTSASSVGNRSPSGYPRAMLLQELRGYVEGPVAYWRSRRRLRRADS